MTTEDMIEDFIQKGIKAYKKLYRCTPEGHKLDRHEKVTIKDIEFSCWRELAVFKMSEYLYVDHSVSVEVFLDGNNSKLLIEIDEKQQQRLNNVLYCFLKRFSEVHNEN